MIEKITEVKISELMESDILAVDVTTSLGKILIVKNTQVNDNLIEGLKKNYIRSIFVFRKVSEEEEIKKINIKALLMKESEDIIDRFLSKHIKKNINSEEIKKIILGILNFETIFNLLLNLRALGERTFRHSIHVSLLSIAVGKEINLPNNRIIVLGMSALFIDIGMSKVPREILQKIGSFTEEEKEIMQKHPKYGFDLVREMNELPIEVCSIILQHHERYDGTGYPNSITHDKMHSLAKIVAVCDVYDALTDDRPHRPKFKRSETMEYLLGTGNFYFNHEIIEALINTVIIYPYGQWVELNTKESGIIIEGESQSFSFRPKVMVYFDPEGNQLEEPVIKDLSIRENINLAIDRVI